MGKVIRSAAYRVGSDDMWRRIGDFQRVEWHPAIARSEQCDDGNRRKLTTIDGAILSESLVSVGSRHYTYRSDESPLPVTDLVSTLRVRATNRGACVVECESEFDTAAGVADEDAGAMIARIHQTGLNAL
jgi:Polyketide cyclase / dehydrase and lipid transport